MAKKGNINYTFVSGNFQTDVVEAKYAHITAPDKEYERYSITVRMDPAEQSTLDLFKQTLEFENECRASAGIEPVEVPGNWTRNGKPNKDDDGFWLVPFALNEVNSKGVTQRPDIINVYGQPDGDVDIWGSDSVVVTFGIACWDKPGSAAAKYFLKGVQQVKPGDNRGGAAKIVYQDMSQANVVPAETPAAEAEDSSDVPF